MLGEADIGLLLALTHGSVHLGGVDALVKGHQHALGGIPSVVVHVTEDVNVGSGLGNNGVNGPSAVHSELVVHQVNGNRPGALGESDGLVAAIGSQVTCNAQEFLGHDESTVAGGAEAVSSDVVPRSLALSLSQLLGEADKGLLLTLTHGSIHLGGVDALIVVHQHTLGGIPSVVVHVTEDVNVIDSGFGRFRQIASAGSGQIDLLGLLVEGDNNGVNTILFELIQPVVVAVLVTYRPAGVPVAVGNDLELNLGAGSSLKAFLGPSEDAVLAFSHEIEGVGCVPVAAEQVPGTSYDVVVFYHGTCFIFLSIQRYNLILKVKLERQVVSATFLKVVVLVVTARSLAPVVVPRVIGNDLVFQ